MTDYKMEAAKAALQLIKRGQTIGFGAGSTMQNMLHLIAKDIKLAESLTFVTSSSSTLELIYHYDFKFVNKVDGYHIDIYFDGCDQFDAQLNALKCGGGIHTSEKIMASFADEFILVGDDSKYVKTLDTTYPLVLEVLPIGAPLVYKWIQKNLPFKAFNTRKGTGKDGYVITESGNYLIDIYFKEPVDLEKMNAVKMVPGVVEHSLFLGIAKKAIIAGEDGVRVLTPR
jgi:ribose 5-phosphate isomerase A